MNTNSLINLERNLIHSAHIPFFGAFAQQRPQAFLSFNRLLNAYNFDTIIEIGTHDGGLSTLFALYCYLSRHKAVCKDYREPSLYKNQTHHRSPKTFVTLDIVVRDEAAIQAIELLEGQFRQRDVLSNPEHIAELKSLIASPQVGRVLLLCDGGSKKRELQLYAGSLKVGDFVMLHDWAKDEAAFESNKQRGIWHSWETRWENGIGPDQQFGIKETCQQYGIRQIHDEEFDESVWFCGVKE